ncbi:hypothetical protein BLOT_009946 [Blomia tropicalis]|nr:hypothetical protein BLOT_009946 [Blomia tropicalis]
MSEENKDDKHVFKRKIPFFHHHHHLVVIERELMGKCHAIFKCDNDQSILRCFENEMSHPIQSDQI